ncbi:FG-GAP-like repeat-containing protein [Nocardioides sp. CCNWLW239]|uniref:FG-GAP-like repeat-containing protein n=1 Tax=Nocardioides sp. CCNWLW239 TaxID=3128902 RepID=UPI003016F8B9
MTDLVVKAQGREWRLEPGRTYTLGRKQGADLVIAGDLVSSAHASVAVVDGAWVLTDLNSTNGTYVAGHRVPSVTLAPGVSVMVGGADDGVRIDVAEAAAPEWAPPPPMAEAMPPAGQGPASPTQPVASWRQIRATRRSLGAGQVLGILGAAVVVVVAMGLVLTMVVFDDGPPKAETVTVTAPKKIPVEGPILGDVNGDEKGDLVVAMNEKDRRFYLSDGGEKFTQQRPGAWAAWGYEFATSGRIMCDFDGDGKADIGAPNEYSYDGPQTYGLHLQTGESQQIQVDAERVDGAYCGDFDGDGHNDVAFAVLSEDKRTVQVSIARQGDGGRWERPASAYETDVPPDVSAIPQWAFHVGDFDGDGKTDLLYGLSTPSKVGNYSGTALLSDGRSFEEGPAFGVLDKDIHYQDRSTANGDLDALRGTAADVNGDGVDEWVHLGIYGWFDVYSLTGERWKTVQRNSAAINSYAWSSVVTSDVNGDHFADVVAVSFNGYPAVFAGSPKGLQPGSIVTPLFTDDTTSFSCLIGIEPSGLYC